MNTLRQHKPAQGFTLLEVLLALSLTTLLLTAATALIVTLFLLWENQSQTDRQTRARSLELWLTDTLAQVAHTDANTGWQINWDNDQRTLSAPTLSWQSDRRNSILPQNAPGGRWEYRLIHNPPHGLFLAWRPTNLEAGTPSNYQYTLLSSQVSALRFAYYDPERERWNVYHEAVDPEREDGRVPDLIALDYTSGKTVSTQWIPLPRSGDLTW